MDWSVQQCAYPNGEGNKSADGGSPTLPFHARSQGGAPVGKLLDKCVQSEEGEPPTMREWECTHIGIVSLIVARNSLVVVQGSLL